MTRIDRYLKAQTACRRYPQAACHRYPQAACRRYPQTAFRWYYLNPQKYIEVAFR